MRISVEPGDEGRATYREIVAGGARVDVYFNGAKQRGVVITADDATGYCKRYVLRRGPLGIWRKVPDPNNRNQALTEELTGAVELRVEANSKPRGDALAKLSANDRMDAAKAKRYRKGERLARIADRGGIRAA